MYKELVYNDIKFNKLNDNKYTCEVNSDLILKYIEEIVVGFTNNPIEIYSDVMDTVISEAILSRIIVDSFISKVDKDIDYSDYKSVVIFITIADSSYTISLADNKESFGGKIYGLLS